ncbi:glycerol dehydrogenase [Pelomyxa schiedti]|nr:glycerol dehydrogenase [Pelomyxa schiedti]
MSSQPNAQVAADARVHHDDDLSWKTAVAALRPTVRSSLFPGKYVQGPGALARAPELIASLLPEGARAKAYLMWNKRTHVKEILESNHVECVANCLEGENTSATVLEHVAISKRSACNVLVGVGGGKLIDCAKAIAHYCDIPCVICPTIASTDAPCSALSIIYDRNGTVESILHLRRNPDIVIVDTEVIVMAPPKTLVAGIGDALATWFEAESCMVKQAPNCGPGGLRGTLTAYTLARCCYKTLLKYAVAAVESNKRHEITRI